MRKYRKPYRAKKKKSIFRSRFFWLGILVPIIFGGIFYLICFSSFLRIKEIGISGNQKVLTEDILARVQTQIRIFFFTSESIFLVNLNKINQDILKTFPQIAKVNSKREFPSRLLIEVEERKPVAVFYQGENYYLIDEEGVIFEKLAILESQPLKTRVSLPSKDLKLGEKVVEKEILSKILEIESKIKNDLKIQLSEILIVSDERVNIKTSEGWEIHFNPKGDVDWQLTKLNAVLEEEIPPERRKDLEYIELRFGNLASYKYR